MATPPIPPPIVRISADFGSPSKRRTQPLLAGVIPGVVTQAIFLPAGQSETCAPLPLARRFVFVVAGAGSLKAGTAATQTFNQAAQLLLPVAAPARIVATTPLTLLEIRFAQAADEIAAAVTAGDTPAVIHYAACPTYREAIKSPQTKNRTIVGPDCVPRFAMGSVETTGPDAVAPHSHPILEQLFFGLPGNDCTVTADGQSVAFGAADLLYIPLGSTHGVEVSTGKQLHYLWIDFFPTAAGMQWLKDQHHDNPPPAKP